jgi:hypothetical protein
MVRGLLRRFISRLPSDPEGREQQWRLNKSVNEITDLSKQGYPAAWPRPGTDAKDVKALSEVKCEPDFIKDDKTGFCLSKTPTEQAQELKILARWSQGTQTTASEAARVTPAAPAAPATLTPEQAQRLADERARLARRAAIADEDWQ